MYLYNRDGKQNSTTTVIRRQTWHCTTCSSSLCIPCKPQVQRTHTHTHVHSTKEKISRRQVLHIIKKKRITMKASTCSGHLSGWSHTLLLHGHSHLGRHRQQTHFLAQIGWGAGCGTSFLSGLLGDIVFTERTCLLDLQPGIYTVLVELMAREGGVRG